jgi:hypothetical protein
MIDDKLKLVTSLALPEEPQQLRGEKKKIKGKR